MIAPAAPSAPDRARIAAIPFSRDRMRAAALLGAAGLIGFGLVLYVAANWDDLGRFEKFWLVGAIILAGTLGALLSRSLHVPGLLLAFAGAGGMLALIGQTYQTGADPWSLFALWAALTLPWALAARSDTLWSAWTLVAMTGVVLWQQAQSPLWWNGGETGRGELLGIGTSLLAAWAMALLLCGAMSAWPPLERALGARRWAFRLAVVVTLAMIAGDTLQAVLGRARVQTGDYLLGILCLCAVAMALVRLARLDMSLLAASALAIDVTLIGGAARLILSPRGADRVGHFLLVGIVAASIVAASVILLMRVAARNGSETGRQAAVDAPRWDTAADVRPWAVALLSGLGAVISAVPFIIALWVLLGSAIERGMMTYVVAFGVLLASVHQLWTTKNLFFEQLATVGLACGGLLLSWGLFRDLPTGLACLVGGLLAITLGLALGRPWLAALLGAVATLSFAIGLLEALGRSPSSVVDLQALIWSAMAASGAAGLVASREVDGTSLRWTNERTIDATIVGWVAAALAGLALAAGSTFMLSAHLGGVGSSPAAGARAILITSGLVSAVLAAAGAIWLMREMPAQRSTSFYALMGTAVVLSLAMPAFGAAALVLAVAVSRGRPALASGASVAALWIVGAFYYSLALPLTHKAAILCAAGVLLGLVSLAAGARLPLIAKAPLQGEGGDVASQAVSRGLTVLGLIVVGAVSAQAIGSREALIRTGTPVFIELVPVDPRSLMQGDYMQLRFRLPDEALRHQPLWGHRPRAIGRRDPDGVLRLTRIGDARTPLAPDETMIEFVHKGGRWIVVTDAWYFKEGTAKTWEAARYGEFRVLSDGSALLVGLADAQRERLK